MNMEISIVCAHGCLILPSSTEAIEVKNGYRYPYSFLIKTILFSKEYTQKNGYLFDFRYVG